MNVWNVHIQRKLRELRCIQRAISWGYGSRERSPDQAAKVSVPVIAIDWAGWGHGICSRRGQPQLQPETCAISLF